MEKNLERLYIYIELNHFGIHLKHCKSTVCVCVCVLVAQLCLTLCDPVDCTVDHQTPLSMEFSRQEYWSGLPFPSPGEPPNPGIKSSLLHCR